MSGKLKRSFRLCGARVLPAILAALFCLPLTAKGQLTSSGYPVINPDWQIDVTDWGYSDVALDNRPGFLGREYLSGEWAAAIHYSGGSNPAGPVCFQEQWFFPDWNSNSNFTLETPFGPASPPMNASGLPVFQSVIKNKDVRVAITYEMLDSINGIPQGTTPKSTVGTGSSILSNRYVFKQTYRVTNISGGNLTNIRFFQLLHGLECTKCLYDDRLYPGAMSEYRYDITQQGDSLGMDTRNGQIVLHHDSITLHSKVQPSAWEAGYYGKVGVDNHDVGKPSIGVHLKVEANNLNNLDFFEPPEEGWVGGAQRYDLGSLAANASATIDLLFTVNTTSEVKFAGVDLKVRSFQKMANGQLRLEFQETSGAPLAFFLEKTTNLTPPLILWFPQLLPYNFSEQTPGVYWFDIPVVPGEPRAFYRVQAILNGE